MTDPAARETSFTNPQVGAVLAGKYRIDSVLGKGGMGVVVAATHAQLGQRVAIKYLLRPDVTEIVARFLREARAAVRLRGEHVARVLDVGEFENGAPYMVMEYLVGDDLSNHLKAHGPLPVEEAIDYLLQTCEAIAEAHAAGIIHRDLKPANLFLMTTPDGSKSVKVLDFGISKVSENDEGGDGMQLTKTEMVLGSPLYMSPEQTKSSRDVDARSDVWALGVILYQLLAGKVPFHANTFSELILKLNLDTAPPISEFRSGVPAGLEAAIFRCFEKKRENRFQNVAELALAIAEFGATTARASAEKARRMLESAGIKVDTTKSPAANAEASSPPPNAQGNPNTQSGMKTVVMSKSSPSDTDGDTDGETGRAAQAKRTTALAAALAFGIAIAAGTIILLRASPKEHIEPAAAVNESAPAITTTANAQPEVKPVAAEVPASAPQAATSSSAAPAVSVSSAPPATSIRAGTKGPLTDKPAATPATTTTTKKPPSSNPLSVGIE